MVSKSKGLTVKNYFVAFFAVFAVVAIVITVYAAQQNTNTQSDATALCGRAPSFDYVSKRTLGTTTYYQLKLTNHCPGSHQFKLRVIQEPNSPIHNFSWKWKFDYPNCSWSTNEGCYIEGVVGSRDIFFKVEKPLTGRALGTKFEQFIVQASVRSNDDLRSRAYFDYVLR